METKTVPKEFSISRGSAWFIVIVCTLLYTVNYMDRQVLSITTDLIKEDLGLSDSQIGVIQTLFFLSMAFFAFPAAYLVDRWSRKKTIGLMALVWSGFTFITGMGKSFLGILIPRFMVGIGEAGFTSGGTPLIGASFPNKGRSLAMGIFNMAVPLGSALGLILGGAISVKFGWRMAFYIFAIPGIILALLAFYMKDYKTVRNIDEYGRKISFFRSAVSLFSIPTLKWLYIGFGLQNFMCFAFLVWAAPLVMRTNGVDAQKAGLLIGIIGLMSIVGSIVGGIAADLWQKKNKRGRMLTATTSLLIATVLFFFMIFYDVRGVGYVIGVFYGIFSIFPVPSISAVTQDVTPPSLKGVSWGMAVFCCYILGGAWSPILVGAVSDSLGSGAYGIKTGLLMTTLGGLFGAFFYWLSARHYSVDMEKAQKYMLEKAE
ncbi:MAG: MFS transporter [Proteobacteria bacterium]|nr:MFS transporter [Pseudomonadota bacterium]MBU1388066.1 MFS transporter [Pseudomonadota bacterium]MBU1542129.1 MFS transporter [Pseudomonadota bacterium]MBU2482393.1 MFS transporter [Pseudomonadota bacterium]